eukprot:13377874-Alexandrium_andersonii.AAC.1
MPWFLESHSPQSAQTNKEACWAILRPHGTTLDPRGRREATRTRAQTWEGARILRAATKAMRANIRGASMQPGPCRRFARGPRLARL